MYRKLKVPMNIQFEITSKCNEKCVHCYNYWRNKSDTSNKTLNMSLSLFDKCMDEIIRHKVLHLIFTGGEPFLNFDVLLHGIQRCVANKMSVSCNSNLLNVNDKKIKQLKEVGLKHILTSLNSHNPATNDFMVSHQGAHKKIVRNIQKMIDSGINISTNMIVSKYNLLDVYETAKLSHELGVKKIHVTRVVPPSYICGEMRKDFSFDDKKMEAVFNQIDNISSDIPIEVKTLIPYPLCALKDLDKYKNLVGRPCAAGKRAMSIDSEGRGHACWHMTQDFGSIVEEGLDVVWDKMGEWRSGQLIPVECKKCPYLALCGGGCRVAGNVFNGALSSPDNLRAGWENISKEYSGGTGVDDVDVPLEEIAKFYKEASVSGKFRVADINIREENGFSVIQIHAGTSFFLEEKYVVILEKMKQLKTFCLEDFGQQYTKLFSYFLTKGAINEKI